MITGGNMLYKLYLDDIRCPGHVGSGWLIARSYEEAIEIVKQNECPFYVSFDHDLGDANAKTGYDFAKWLVEQDLDHGILPDNFDFNVHSANPVGAANITGLLDSYLKTR
jgi:hypothetical protein